MFIAGTCQSAYLSRLGVKDTCWQPECTHLSLACLREAIGFCFCFTWLLAIFNSEFVLGAIRVSFFCILLWLMDINLLLYAKDKLLPSSPVFHRKQVLVIFHNVLFLWL